MNNPRRRVVARLLGLVLATCVLAMQLPSSSASFVDPDEAGEGRGRPMPRPDSPGAAVAFRQLQWNNEYGWIPENGLVEGRMHANAMRARGRSAMFPGRRESAPQSAPGAAPSAPQGPALPSGPPPPPSAGIGPSVSPQEGAGTPVTFAL